MALQKSVQLQETARYARADNSIPAFKAPKDGDAGYDLYAKETKWIWPFKVTKIPTNLYFEIPQGYVGKVTGRSGMTSKGNIAHDGTIDSSYRGEISVTMHRVGLLPRRMKKGDRIAQLVILPFVAFKATEEVEIAELTPTARGDKGFGSSGLR